jgi:hypothetical protein
VKRLLLATALVALPCSVLAARPLDPPRQHAGTFRVSFYVVSGPDAIRVTQADYEKAVRDGLCGPRSHVTLWPARPGRSAEVQAVCEAG